MVETVSVDTVEQRIENDDAAVVNVLAREDFEAGLVGWKEAGHETASAN